MDILLLQFCSIACEDLQGHFFVKIAERFNVLFAILLPVKLLLKDSNYFLLLKMYYRLRYDGQVFWGSYSAVTSDEVACVVVMKTKYA